MIRSVLGIEYVRNQRLARDCRGPGDHRRPRRARARGRRSRGAFFVLSGRATFTVDGERVDAPGRLDPVRQGSGDAARRDCRRGVNRDPRHRRPAGCCLSVSPWERSARRCVAGRPATGIGRSRSSLNSRGSRQCQRPLQPRLRRVPLGPGRCRDRPPDAGGQSSSFRDSPSSRPTATSTRFAATAASRRPRPLPLRVARQPHSLRERAEPRHDVVLRSRHEQRRRVLRPRERQDEELEPNCQRKCLVSEIARTGRAPRPGRARRSRRRRSPHPSIRPSRVARRRSTGPRSPADRTVSGRPPRKARRRGRSRSGRTPAVAIRPRPVPGAPSGRRPGDDELRPSSPVRSRRRRSPRA